MPSAAWRINEPNVPDQKRDFDSSSGRISPFKEGPPEPAEESVSRTDNQVVVPIAVPVSHGDRRAIRRVGHAERFCFGESIRTQVAEQRDVAGLPSLPMMSGRPSRSQSHTQGTMRIFMSTQLDRQFGKQRLSFGSHISEVSAACRRCRRLPNRSVRLRQSRLRQT